DDVGFAADIRYGLVGCVTQRTDQNIGLLLLHEAIGSLFRFRGQPAIIGGDQSDLVTELRIFRAKLVQTQLHPLGEGIAEVRQRPTAWMNEADTIENMIFGGLCQKRGRRYQDDEGKERVPGFHKISFSGNVNPCTGAWMQGYPHSRDGKSCNLSS